MAIKISAEGKLLENASSDSVQFLPLHSEDMEEIISRRPGFFETLALPLLLSIIIGGIITTAFIRYPDVISTDGTLIAENAPKELIAAQSGRIVKILVSNNQHVDSNQVIGCFESNANIDQVLNLSIALDSARVLIAENRFKEVHILFKGGFTKLGEIQNAYQEFSSSLQLLNDYFGNGFYEQKISLLNKDIGSLNAILNESKEEKKITEEDLKIAQESFQMNDVLYKEKVISKQEYRDQQSKLLNRKSILPQINSAILQNENTKREKQKEVNQLNHDLQQQKITFLEALNALNSKVDDWKKKYLLVSPVKGSIVFASHIQRNQYLQAGKILGFINPNDSHFFSEVYLPQNNFGKVQKLQKVQLRINAYPYEEYGTVEGYLSDVSNVASDSGFLARIELPNGLHTTHNMSIQFKNGLRTRALIITKSTSLLQRIYYNIVRSANFH